ncbi:MAG TPA: hypothetical protein VLG14_11475 [Sphingomonas sp.]|nr:hypothetical protein [Sphingomonas sp.]
MDIALVLFLILLFGVLIVPALHAFTADVEPMPLRENLWSIAAVFAVGLLLNFLWHGTDIRQWRLEFAIGLAVGLAIRLGLDWLATRRATRRNAQ